MTKPEENARVVVKAARKFKKPIACVFMGGVFTKKSVRVLHENGVPNYGDPVKAAEAFASLLNSR
ncbi:MAG TPA: hypothetical protein VJI71_00735 [Candidatus Norongarragalinales archaeon]|nr:hypothetical protein [Candidatus Norongarragalinales archaeon]